jgi:hypothetical protein
MSLLKVAETRLMTLRSFPFNLLPPAATRIARNTTQSDTRKEAMT